MTRRASCNSACNHTGADAIKLEQVLESTSDCVFGLDREWRFTFLNGHARHELAPAENLLGKHILESFPRLVETPFWSAYREVMSMREPRHVEAYMPGLNSWYAAYAAPIDDGITVFFRNIDARRRGEAALKQRELQLRKTLDHIPQIVWSTLPDGYHDYYSRLWYEFTGAPEGSTDGDGWNGMFHPDDQQRAWGAWRHSLETGEPYEIEYRLRHRSGDYRWVLGRAWPERDGDGHIVRWYGTCTDIHELVCARQLLDESEALQHSVLEASVDCIKVLGLSGEIIFVNGPGCRAMDLASFEEVQGRLWPSLWPTKCRQRVQEALKHSRSGKVSRFTGYCPTAIGKPKWWDIVVSPILDKAGNVVRLLSVSRDITALKETSEKLKWASEHDALTTLPNRRTFEVHLQAATLRSMQKGSLTGVLLIDFDHFKHVNDTLGHAAGDYLLREQAARLSSSTRSNDFVARLGGDEFAVILEDIGSPEEIVNIGKSILERLKEPLRFDGREINASASIGGAIFPQDATTAQDLLKNADTALYALKSAGRGGTNMFHSHMREESQRIASQLSLARTALNEQSILPHYQPKIRLQNGDLSGCEALLRWWHPTRGIQEPESVAEAFKDFELASRIGTLMHRKVFADLASWRQKSAVIDHVALNAAPVEFLRDDYAERFLSLLDEFQIAPTWLEVEVTEHALFDSSSGFVARALKKLKAAGVRIALDDFGTGHSSLSHLRDFPVDVVKIDRSFVGQMVEDGEIAAIVKAVVDLSHSLSIDVVAEGIECKKQLDLLKVMGCDLGQGWLFGKPVQSEELFRLESRAA